MTSIGYTLMTEQAGPRDLVDHASLAEAAGFDFEVRSDHYFPWLDEQGRAPYAWSVLGAVSLAESVGAFWEAGFTDVALVQTDGDSQPEFLRFAESDLFPALR